MASFTFPVAIVVCAFLGLGSGQVKRGCKVQTLRDCGSDYVVYSNTTRLPEGGVEFDKHCRLYLKQIGCAQKFSETCLENLPRVVTLLVLNAAEEDFEAACTEGTERHELYKKSIQCMNAAGKELNACIGNLYNGFQTAVSNAPREEMVYYACCTYHSALECAETALAARCEDPELPALEFITSVMERVFGQVLGLVCGPYSRGSKSCHQIPTLPPLAPGASRTLSLIELAIEVASSLRKKP